MNTISSGLLRSAVRFGLACAAVTAIGAGCAYSGADLAAAEADEASDGAVAARADATPAPNGASRAEDEPTAQNVAAVVTPEPAAQCLPLTEVCNGVDDDCDGVVDDGCPVAIDVSSVVTATSPTFGGTGGSPSTLDCPAGQVAIGIYGRAGASIDRLGLDCGVPTVLVDRSQREYFYRLAVLSSGQSSPPAGGLGGSSFAWANPEPSSLVDSFQVRSGGVVNGFSVGYEFHWLRNNGGWSVAGQNIGNGSPTFGTASGTFNAFACPNDGEAITGLVVRSGTLLDAVGVRCRRLTVRVR